MLKVSTVLFAVSFFVATLTAGEKTNSFIVHEWGTFTSFSGSDGVPIQFRPLADHQLPKFVVRSPSLIKGELLALQRMETPVTYFYTDHERIVDVSVRFPGGLLTEFYPPASEGRPPSLAVTPQTTSEALLQWNSVTLLPSPFPENATLPPVTDDDHYGHARKTDSALVRFVDPASGQTHHEKFLFYRGVGNFRMPLILRAEGHDRFVLSNSGTEPVRAAFLIEVDEKRVRFTSLAEIQGDASAQLPQEESNVAQLAESIVKALVADGLYEKEAIAMVDTWRSSWLEENGTRVLYTVPRSATDHILPLTIHPAPDETVRVMIGRLEILTPEDEKTIAQLAAGVASPVISERKAAAKELRKFGRFGESALSRVSELPSNK